MVRRSDRAGRSKSVSRPTAADSAAAADQELEGESVRKTLFPDEAEVSRRRKQRRRELIHQHEHPRKPTPLMDLNVKVKSDLNVKVHQERRSKSMHRLAGQSEMAGSSRTVHLIPAGAESTHRQQQGARPKQIAVSIFPDCQPSDAVTRDTANAIGAADNATNAARTANAATFLHGIGRGLGNRFLRPQGYETMAWEEKQIWDERANILMKRVLPQLAPGFCPNLKAWRKAPDNWPRPGTTDEDSLHEWLKFEKQARADENFTDIKPPARKSTAVQNYNKMLKERFRTCEWRIFLPDGFYGCEEEDIPPWMQRWCQLLLEMVPEHECPELYEGRHSSEDWCKEFRLYEARKQVRLGSTEEEEAQRTRDHNHLQRTQKSSDILLPDVVAGCLVPRDFAAAARRAYMALRIHEGVTKDYRETEREMWNQYWWLKGIGELGGRLPLKEFIMVRRPTREEVQRFQADWKWEMAHANDWDPYAPVKVNKDGETVILSNAPKCQDPGSQQDQAIAKALSTVGPPSVSTGRFQDRSTNAPPGITAKPELEPMEDFEEEHRPLASRYSPKRFEAALCLWYIKLDSKSQKDLFTYGPKNFECGPEEEHKTVNYVARGVTEHLKYELGLPEDEQWIVLKWIQTYLDWELFRDARQLASTAIGHEELHEMSERAILTLPMTELRESRSVPIKRGVFLAGLPAPTPEPSPTGSDTLSSLSSCSVTPPSTTEEDNRQKKAAARDPRRQTAITRQTQTVLDPSGAAGPFQPQWTLPEWPIWQAPVLGRGTPLRPAAPLPGMVATAAPLPGTIATAAPLLGTVATAAPLPGTVATVAPLPEMADTDAPLPETADADVPLPEEQASTVHSSPGATPLHAASEPNLPSPTGSADQRAGIPPARPEDFWYAEESASGPLPLETEDPAPLQADEVSTTGLSLTGTHPVGPAPLAVPENNEVSPTGSPQGLECASEAPVQDPRPSTPARMGRPSIAEVLQQWVVHEQVTITTIEKEETIKQRPSEAEVEPMIISGGNTPVALDDADLEIDEDPELLMDETRL